MRIVELTGVDIAIIATICTAIGLFFGMLICKLLETHEACKPQPNCFNCTYYTNRKCYNSQSTRYCKNTEPTWCCDAHISSIDYGGD